MKINKKIIVPVLSTVMGLSLIGGVSGAVAWYQYNSRVTTSFVGVASANSGLLQINSENAAVDASSWKKDLGLTPEKNLIPVTFGAMGTNDALPAKAYSTPEAGAGSYNNNGWQTAVAGKDFVQYDIYLQALQLNNTTNEMERVERKVYLSDITMAATAATQTAGKDEIVDALRLHLAVDGGSNFFVSKTKVENMELYGNLDLDGDGNLDTVNGYVWQTNPDLVMYGNEGEKQTTKGISEVKSTRNTETQDYDSNAHLICTTKTTGAVKITVTAWLEGWTKLTPTGSTTKSSIWDVVKTDGAVINIGMEFDVGRNAFIPE